MYLERFNMYVAANYVASSLWEPGDEATNFDIEEAKKVQRF